MALETKASSQSKPIRARREVIAEGPTGTTIDPGNNIKFFICKNVGTNPIRLNFNGQANANYWNLEPGDTLPVTINISPDTVILARATGGATSILESILWG